MEKATPHLALYLLQAAKLTVRPWKIVLLGYSQVPGAFWFIFETSVLVGFSDWVCDAKAPQYNISSVAK